MILSSLTQIQAAALLSIAPRTLRDWADCPRNADGSYPGPALVAYYAAKMGGNSGEFDDQRERLAAAQAEKVETENALRRKQLAVVSDVVAAWTDHILACRAKLLSLPSKLSPVLLNLDDPNLIAATIRAEVNAALAELAEYQPAEVGPGSHDAGVESVGATA